MMGTQSPETCREKKINILRKILHQVGFIYKITFSTSIIIQMNI